MSAAERSAPLLARFVALDIAAQAEAPKRALPFGRSAIHANLRRAALILALSRPDAGELTTTAPAAPGAPEALFERWWAAVQSLEQRAGWRSPLRSPGRFVAVALGFSADVRAREHAAALEETLLRLGEARLRAPRTTLVVTAALLVSSGVREGTGIVPSFERLRALAAARNGGLGLAAAACAPEARSVPVPDDSAALARARAVLQQLMPKPRAQCLDDLAATLAVAEGRPTKGHASLAAGVAARST